jgi:hypothetical protein
LVSAKTSNGFLESEQFQAAREVVRLRRPERCELTLDVLALAFPLGRLPRP